MTKKTRIKIILDEDFTKMISLEQLVWFYETYAPIIKRVEDRDIPTYVKDCSSLFNQTICEMVENKRTERQKVGVPL